MRATSMAGAYLEQALEAFRDASSPDVLYVELDPWHRNAQILGPAQRDLDAINRRVRLHRASVLFAACAAEACANEFIAATLAAADGAMIDRVQTVEKLLVAPRLAGHESPFERSAEPIQTLTALFPSAESPGSPAPR